MAAFFKAEQFVNQYNRLTREKNIARIAKDYHDYGHVDIERAGDVIATITYGPPAHYSTCFLADMDWTFFSEGDDSCWKLAGRPGDRYMLGHGSKFTTDELKLMLEFAEGIDRSKVWLLFS